MEFYEKIPEFFIEMLNLQYGKELAEEILQGYNVTKKSTFRVNTIKSDVQKIEEELVKNNIQYEKVSWYKDAFIIKNEDEKIVRKLSIYENGEIYFQSLSSMLPPIILNPKSNKDILDMTAAPGSKTTQLAALSNNQAHITACEMNSARAERLKYNIEKQGASCVYVMIKDSRRIDDFFSFDQILLDAPCSGSGTININDIKLKEYFTEKLIQKSQKSQIDLLSKAIKILKKGQEMIYSTCSILQAENEYIINKVLKNENAEVVPIEFKRNRKITNFTYPNKRNNLYCSK